MCAHSSSGKTITDQITNQVYPAIESCFDNVINYLRQNAICNGATPFFDQFYTLKTEFESLKNYDTRLVFPSVLNVFNSKDDQSKAPKINVRELQQLTKKKENAIAAIVAEMEIDAELLQLESSHPIFPLIHILKTDFLTSKKIWNKMLDGWSTGCACFSAANDPTMKIEIKD